MAPPSARTRKYHHLTCSNCRKRKTKCDGLEPICTTCKGLGVANCKYDKPASIAYVRYLEKQVSQLTKELDGFRLGSSSTTRPTTDSSGSAMPRELEGSMHIPQNSMNPGDIMMGDDDLGILNQYAWLAQSTREEQEAHLLNLVSATTKIEDFAIELAILTNFDFVDINTAKHFMAYFWAWIHPHHMHIYRPMFFRHLINFYQARGQVSQCYSPALLGMMLAESARNLAGIESDIYHQLENCCYSLLMRDLREPFAKLASVNACILLSDRAIFVNNRAQAWVFFGAAVRLGSLLQLETAPEMLAAKDVTVEEAEVRRRVHLGLVQHDLIISLYMDSPTDQKLDGVDPSSIIDGSFDFQIWRPVIEVKGSAKLLKTPDGEYNEDPEPIIQYQNNCQNLYVHCFRWKIKLLPYVSDILAHTRQDITHMLNVREDGRFSVIGTIEALQAFWLTVPQDLKVVPGRTCVLPHIVSFNLLYYTCFAMLLLPVFQQATQSVDSYFLTVAQHAATSIRHCIHAHSQLFGVNTMSFFHTYSCCLVYQMIEVSMPEYARMAGFGQVAMTDHLHFFARCFKVCSFTPSLTNSAVEYACNRPRYRAMSATAQSLQTLGHMGDVNMSAFAPPPQIWRSTVCYTFPDDMAYYTQPFD